MSALLFDSLEIRRFRAFEHLRIEKLGRVNLIVGQNNVGKSCLLEALQVYAERAHPAFLWQLLESHDEGIRSLQSALAPLDKKIDQTLSIVKNLFYEWPEMAGLVEPIEIGPIDSPEATLRLTLEWYSNTTNGAGQTIPQLSSSGEHNHREHTLPHFSVQLGANHTVVYPLEISFNSEALKPEIPPLTCLFTNGHGFNKRKVSELWDHTPSPDLRQEVICALRILAPGVESIDMVGDMKDTNRERFPVLMVPSHAGPLPIQTLGTGIQWMLSIALSLVNAKDGLLLIDEIGHELHYAAQFELWQLVFEMSRRLNIQVFATTHSWDSVLSFQQALKAVTQSGERSTQEDEQAEAMLIRLDFKKGDVHAVLYDEPMLTDEDTWDIEVR
jgi:ABC-type branched-subunit amino acid transport system ATPase component